MIKKSIEQKLSTLILQGQICQVCKEYIGPPCGYMRFCDDCNTDQIRYFDKTTPYSTGNVLGDREEKRE